MKWFWLVWVLAGLTAEAIALLNAVPNDTLTMTIVASVPGWLVFAGIGWLVWHFLQAYRDRRGK